MDKNKIINQYYDEFKVFIKENKMPLIIPVEKSSENNNMDEFAFIEKDFIRGIAVPIIYNKSLFDYNENFVKSIFFHEFTHIYDANIRFKNLNEKDFNTVIDSYSEYHASQIEMGSLIGMKNKNDVLTIASKLEIKSKVFYKNELEDIESYIITPLADITSIICQDRDAYIDLSDFEFAKQYVKLEKNIFYYYGKYDLYTKYANKNMPDLLQKNCQNFSDIISKIHNAVKTKNIEPSIYNIRNLLKNFQDNVYTYFLKR